jgi:hypothetical protein
MKRLEKLVVVKLTTGNIRFVIGLFYFERIQKGLGASKVLGNQSKLLDRGRVRENVDGLK